MFRKKANPSLMQNKNNISQIIKECLEQNKNKINSKLGMDIYNVYRDELIDELTDSLNGIFDSNMFTKKLTLTKQIEKQIIDEAIILLEKKLSNIENSLSSQIQNIVDTSINEKNIAIDNEKKDLITLQMHQQLQDFITDFVKHDKKVPTESDLKLYIEKYIDNNLDEDVSKEPNNKLFKEYDLIYNLENSETASVALKELKEIINNYNINNPSDQISINIIDNLVHAKINKGMFRFSRLKKIAANQIWELLKELNFDLNWIQQNQSNGVTATFYEGTLNSNSINYSNIQHFIIYYDGPTVAKTNSRLKKVAEQLLLDDPNKDVLLLPEPNYYYAITADALNSTINTQSNSIENAVNGLKQFSNFIDAEKWILNQKPDIIARDGNNIPNDNGTWDNFYKDIYEKYYNENGNVPESKREQYEITISITDSNSANKIYNDWINTYKDIFSKGDK